MKGISISFFAQQNYNKTKLKKKIIRLIATFFPWKLLCIRQQLFGQLSFHFNDSYFRQVYLQKVYGIMNNRTHNVQ